MRRVLVGLSAVAVGLAIWVPTDPAAARKPAEQRLIVLTEGSFSPSEEIRDISGREVGSLTVTPARGSGLSVAPRGTRFAFVEPEVVTGPLLPRLFPGHRGRQVLRHSALVVGSFLESTGLPAGSGFLISSQRPLFDRVVGRPAWSPNEGRLVAGRRTRSGIHLFVARASGRPQARQLTSGESQDTNPAWAPTGTTIVFERRGRSGTDLYAVTPDGTHLRNLTGWRGEERWPSWSPDGRSIAFASNGSGLYRLYTLNVESGVVRRIEAGSGNSTMPRWSPDGRSLAYVSDADGDADVHVVELLSRRITAVTHNDSEDTLEDWQPVSDTRPPAISVRPVSIGPDGRVMLTAVVRDRSDRVLVVGETEVSGGLRESGFSSSGVAYRRTGRPPLRIAKATSKDEFLNPDVATLDDLTKADIEHCVAAVDRWGNSTRRCAPIRFRKR